MAAQAVDVTLSGHINRALFIVDRDDNPATTGAMMDESGTKSSVKDNATSGTRIRVTGSGEMMDGGSAGVNLEYAAGASLALRYAEVWFSGDYGKVSIGQGDQGGEGSVYHGGAAVWGTGHGQDNAGVTKHTNFSSAAEMAKGAVLGAKANYYTSLDGGAGRNERVRYDTPAIGPLSASVSIGSGDVVSAGISLSQEFGGTSFAAGVGTVMWPNDNLTGANASTISASAGVTLPSGISISGAWGSGKDHNGAYYPAVTAGANLREATMAGMPFTVRPDEEVDGDFDAPADTTDQDTLTEKLARIEGRIANKNVDGTTNAGVEKLSDAEVAALKVMYNMALMAHQCVDYGEGGNSRRLAKSEYEGATGATPAALKTARTTLTACPAAGADNTYHTYATPAVPGTPARAASQTVVDPSFMQVAVSYAFGDTSVGVSWYQSSDAVHDGSELTAIGAGVNHALPKLGANIYAAAQNYTVDDGAWETDDTVVMIGTRITF